MKEKREKLAGLVAQIKTATDVEQKRKLIAEAEVLKGEIETDASAANLITWAEGGQTPQAKSGPANLQFGKQVGTDQVQFDEKGNIISVEAEGDVLTEKAFQAIREPSYKAAWLRHAANPEHTDQHDLKILGDAFGLAKKNFQEGLDIGGGYLVPGDFIQEIIRRDPQPSNVMDLVRTIPIGSDRLVMPRLDYQGATDDTNGDIFDNPMRIQWTGEATRPGTTTRPNFGQVEIAAYEGLFEMPYSRTLADDAGSFFGEFLQEELRNSYRLGIESTLVNGDGVAKPSGLLLAPGANVYQPPTVNIGNPATANGLTDWILDLPEQYATGDCRWIANRTQTYKQWAKIQDTAGNYIFGLTQNISGGLMTPRTPNILGYDGAFSPFMPAAGAGNYVGIFGNFRRAYYMAQRLAMQVRFQDLPREAFAYAVVRFRIGGQIVQPRALRVAVQS